jgi:hypothetical protein
MVNKQGLKLLVSSPIDLYIFCFKIVRKILARLVVVVIHLNFHCTIVFFLISKRWGLGTTLQCIDDYKNQSMTTFTFCPLILESVFPRYFGDILGFMSCAWTMFSFEGNFRNGMFYVHMFGLWMAYIVSKDDFNTS